MNHLYEGGLIDTKDGIQFKVYANSHPDGVYLTRPKYVPQNKIKAGIFHSRFLFEKAMARYNPFAKKDGVAKYLKAFRKHYPEYIYRSPLHKREFFGVPEKMIERIHDPKTGLQELLRIPDNDLDKYLYLVKELVLFLKKSGVSDKVMGITNSTLLGNYTFGKSDIDIMVFGKRNGWRIYKFLETHKHPLMRWKTKKEWQDYYRDHKIEGGFTENDFIFHNSRKRNEGMFGEHVFTIFCAEEKNELWSPWGKERYEPAGRAVIHATVADDYNSIVRPGGYGLKKAVIVKSEGTLTNLPVKEIMTYSLPLLHQTRVGERIEAAGLLEKVFIGKRASHYRLVSGYQSPTPERVDGYIKTIR
jgi:predicted nucleotidyltransferase